MKRKASKTPLKAVVEEPPIATLVTPIVSEGDLQLDFTKDLSQPLGLLVSRHTLCLSSPVFKAMFSNDSPWCDSANRTLNADGIQVFRLEDDDIASMEIIMNIIHLQCRKIPRVLLFPQLDSCASLCDKYDLEGCLGGWPDIWMRPYLDRSTEPGFGRWLFISSIFKEEDIFAKITRHLALNTTLSDAGELLYQGDNSFSEGMPASTLGWLAETRADSIHTFLRYCWEACQKRCEHRNNLSIVSEIEDCEAVNLGCLSRQFPDLCEPTKASERERRSVLQILDAINRIKHFEDMDSLDSRFTIRHGACDIGHFIQGLANRCVDLVQGRNLRSASSKTLPPTWFNHMLADLRLSFPDALIQGTVEEAHVSCLTDSIAYISNEHTSTSVYAHLPVLCCLDCYIDSWVVPRPEKKCSEFEEHLKSTQHLHRVQRRMDLAWEKARRRVTGSNRQ